MAGVSALVRKQRTHREARDLIRKNKVEKRERVREMLLKHREEKSDSNVTNIQGWKLDENDEVVKIDQRKDLDEGTVPEVENIDTSAVT